eukprot:Skav217121  [mRNA]  locus=scaffold783:248990:253129:+ [translate_table: standard]
MFFIGICQCNTWLASPPCQPWSKAGVLKGLATNDGVMFPRMIMLAAQMQALCLLAENVPGIQDHLHFARIKSYVSQVGWRCVLSSQDKVMPLLPINRNRWLGFFVPDTQLCNIRDIQKAEKMKIPASIPGIGTDTSVGFTGSVQYNMEEWEKEQAKPSEEALQLMSVYSLLPSNVRTKVMPTTPPPEILEIRTRTPRQCFPNVMAQHGVQHELPIRHLKEKGLHAFLLNVNGEKRFATPYEIGSSMGYPANLVLPCKYKEAWHIMGNGLSIAHSMIACFRAHIILANHSPFTCPWDSVDQLCAEIKTGLVDLSDLSVVREGSWMSLKPTVLVPVHPSMPTQVEPEPYTPDFVEPPPCKRQCLSPTWMVEDDEPVMNIPQVDLSAFPNRANLLGTAVAEDASLLTKQQNPFPNDILKCFNAGEVTHKDDHHIAIILHDQGIWYRPAWRKSDEPVSTTIRKVLPHATREMFDAICIGGYEVLFGTIPNDTTSCDIFFTPNYFTRMIVSQLLSQDLPLRVDVTWTFADVLAYVAAEAAVLSNSLSIFTEGKEISKDDFVLATDATCFNVRFKTQMLTMDRLAFVGNHPLSGQDVVQQNEDSIPSFKNEAKQPAKFDVMRFAFRTPKWNTIKTVAATIDTTFATVLEQMFPGIDRSHFPVCMIDDAPIDPQAQIGFLTEHHNIELHFPGNPQLPNESVSMMKAYGLHWTESEVMSKIHVQGPFDHRPTLKQFPATWNLTKVLAAIMDTIACDLVVMPTMQGKTIDPRTLLDQLPNEPIIRFRACALPGGAKNDDVHEKLGKILKARGVPDEILEERVKLIMSKLSIPELRTTLAKDDPTAWADLKVLATNGKVRLITAAELKTFQKGQRKEKAEHSASSKEDKKRIRNPKQISIDANTFVAAGERVFPLDFQKFGPDAKGVAIVTVEQALAHVPVARISADPLALVIVSNKPIAGQHPVQMPAHDATGIPILTMAVILNFGDTPVECKPKIPSSTLTTLETMTIEFKIVKQLVAAWEDVQNPMVCLGKLLPEVRTEQVIASWAIRFYDQQRKVVSHNQADYAHGYLKIPSQFVEPILKRSGQSGLFLQAKNEQKKPDPRYGIIPMYGATLEETIAAAQKATNTLGVVIMNDQPTYAIRGRREHIITIRKAVLPQGLTLQEGTINPDATWFLIRGIKTSTNCELLTRCLKEMNWDAQAIRPKGPQTWLICAQADPPAQHVVINNEYASIIPIGFKHAAVKARSDQKSADTSAPLQANFSMCPEDDDEISMASTTTTRFNDLRTGLEDQIQSLVANKMLQYDAKFNDLHETIAKNKAEADQVHQKLQCDIVEVQKSQHSIQAQITDSNNSVVSQMQSLFQEMQKSFTEQIEGLNQHEPKCRKTTH